MFPEKYSLIWKHTCLSLENDLLIGTRSGMSCAHFNLASLDGTCFARNEMKINHYFNCNAPITFTINPSITFVKVFLALFYNNVRKSYETWFASNPDRNCE